VRLPSIPSSALTSLRTILMPLAVRLACRRACVHPAAQRGDHVHRGPAFHTTQDCTPYNARITS
jgi:hypothetical protein